MNRKPSDITILTLTAFQSPSDADHRIHIYGLGSDQKVYKYDSIIRIWEEVML